MGRRARGDPDRSAAIYAAVISALIAGGHANFDPWPSVTYIDATARSSAGPVAVKDEAGARWRVTGTTGIYSVS